MEETLSNPKKILVIVTGGIAAYKAAELVSTLKKQNYSVRCILTESAKEFITPLTFETLSGYKVGDNLFSGFATEHIEWARWPDLVAVVPATANFIGKFNAGICNSFALTVLMATRAPIVIAPAMNTAMWENEILSRNIESLIQLTKPKCFIIPPQQEGKLACGEEGAGKLAPLETIDRWIKHFFASRRVFSTPPSLQGKNILITAGPTIGAIDAVRYMTNPATGRMGIALAEALAFLGANVFLVLGKDKGTDFPVFEKNKSTSLNITPILTARQMLHASENILQDFKIDALFASAAVLDFEVKKPLDQKQKRTHLLQANSLQLELEPSVDVLASLQQLAQKLQQNTLFIGFAAETQNLLEYATEKMKKKSLDFLFVNRVAPQTLGTPLASGFGVSTNSGYLLSKNNAPLEIELQTKESLAHLLIKNTLCS